jgi:hypothetical protein
MCVGIVFGFFVFVAYSERRDLWIGFAMAVAASILFTIVTQIIKKRSGL